MSKEEATIAFRKPANNSVVITDGAGGEVLRINKDGVLVNPAYPLDEAAQYVINALDKHIKKVVAQQEPDAFVPREAIRTLSGGANHVPATLTLNDDGGKAVAVFLSPPAQLKSLTPEQKKNLWNSARIELPSKENCYYQGIADSEAYHGIKEQP